MFYMGAYRAVNEEGGQAGGNLHLDLDRNRLNAAEGKAADPGEAHAA